MNTVQPYAPVLEMCLSLALILPLISFFISMIINEKYSWLVTMIAPLLMFISAGSAIYSGISLWNNPAYLNSWTWITLGNATIEAGIMVDNLSALMLMVVTSVSFLVHLYSLGYMAGDAGTKRYFSMLGLFTFSMLGIVVSDNLLLIFIFWELVGFSSFMLIGHWQHNPAAAAASKKAFVFNRIGDAGFLIGMMVVWAVSGGFSLAELDSQFSGQGHTIAALCLFCGVIGKSAQFPLFTWLPDAMEGPTPVSALIHAATMVAAGVFLLARIDFIFSREALLVVASIGILTALLAAIAALVQTDIKKVLAYSTISQLGLMVTAAGAGAPEAAVLHLFTHAFFKACLFLCAGSIIHVLHQAQHSHHVHFDVQDIRNLGGLRRKMPFTFIAMVVSSCALAGIPVFSGFVSKEAIFSALNAWRGDSFNLKWIIFALAFVVSALTVVYTFRLVAKIFMGEESATAGLKLEEPPLIMRGPVALLAFGSLWFVASWNPIDFNGWLIDTPIPHSGTLTIFSMVWILGSVSVAYWLFREKKSLSSRWIKENYYLDSLYAKGIAAPVLALSEGADKADRKVIDRFLHTTAYLHVLISHLIGWFDRAIIDGFVNAMAYLARLLGSFTRSFQGGKIQLYVFWAAFTIIIFLIWSLI